MLLIEECEKNQLLQRCSKILNKRQNKRAKYIFYNLIHNRLNTQGEKHLLLFLAWQEACQNGYYFLKYFKV